MRFSFLGAARRSRLRRRAIVAASALALGFGLAAVASTQASAATGCSVAYATSSEWPGGFVANVTITNTGTSSINGWTLTFTYPGDQRVTNAWNTALTQSGKNITATNLRYNATIAPGGNTVIGWQGIWTTSDAPPTSFSINGTACNGGGGGLSPTVSLTSPTNGQTFTAPANMTLSANADSTSTGSATFTASASGYTSASVTVTETTSGGGGGHVADPFTGASTYKNPDFVNEVRAQAAADGNNPAEAAVANYQTAIWMDRIAAITGDSTHMGLQAQLDNAETQVQGTTPLVFEVVIYDLPGRDCAALASNGEIPATSAGLTQYETQYIDPITSILAMPKYSNLRIVAIIEPDSLPNVVTNQSQSACSTATPLYEQGITYAQNKQAITNVYNFIGIAHSAWLGWPSNMSATPGVYNTVVKATTAGYASIDGFISDTANYTPTQEPLLTNPTLSIGGQPVDSATFYQFNPTFDELNYDTQMYNTLVSAGFPASKKFLIDTSRNGWGPTHPTTITQTSDVNSYVAANKIDKRPFRGDWCNQNNSGIGTRPADQPFGASSPIEAFVWIKPPGESDGDYPTATHTHGDPHCDPNGTNTDGNGGTYSTGSIPGFDVPAGQWFPAEFQMLVKNAFPALP